VQVPVKDPMTVEEAARFLAVDEITLVHLAEDRQVPAIKVGDQWTFSRKSLQKWQKLRARQGAHP
jgi:excisionase family DNA binding protein